MQSITQKPGKKNNSSKANSGKNAAKSKKDNKPKNSFANETKSVAKQHTKKSYHKKNTTKKQFDISLYESISPKNLCRFLHQ